MLAVIVTGGASFSGAQADPQEIKGGSIVWGVKDSFRCYVLQAYESPSDSPGCAVPPPGAITMQAPASVDNPEARPRAQIFRFPGQAGGQYDPSAGTANLRSAGGVHFKKDGHIDLTLSDIRINLAGAGGTLVAKVRKPFNAADSTGPIDPPADRTLGYLDLQAGEVGKAGTGGITTWTKVPVSTCPLDKKRENGTCEITPDSVQVFGRDYGTLDSIAFSIDTGGPRPVASGHADWAVMKAFRQDMAGSPPFTGSTLHSDDVKDNADGSFRFPAKAEGEFAPAASSADGRFGGFVRFSNLLGKQTDIKIENLRIVVNGGSGSIRATVTKLGAGAPAVGESRLLADLRLDGIEVSTLGNTATWANIPAFLNANAEDIFSGYRAGEPMDPLTITLSSDPASAEPSPTPSPTPNPSPSSPAPGQDDGQGASDQQEAKITGGYMEWGLKKSFRDYINGSIAHGEMTTGDGAAPNPDGSVKFPAARKGKVGAAAAHASPEFAGFVRFTGHNGQLDLRLSTPRVEISGGAGSLLADVTSKGRAGEGNPNPAPRSWTGLRFAALDLSSTRPSSSGSTLAWNDIPATLTAEGAEAFSGFYQHGTQLDPVRMVLELSGEVGAAAAGAAAAASGGPVVSLDKSVVRPGEKLTVTSPGLQPGEQAEVWVHSTPVFVGAATSNGSGKAIHTFVVPAVPPGAHRVELKAISSEKSLFSSPFTVVAGADRPGRLPSTGINSAEVFLFALAWLTAGAAFAGAGQNRICPAGHGGLFSRMLRRNACAAAVVCTVTVFMSGTAFGQEGGSVAPQTTLSGDGLSVTDGTRTLTVSRAQGVNEQGEQIRVEGRGYGDPVGYKGIYVAFCVIPPTNQQPTPCLGGRDTTGQNTHSHWITSGPPPNSEGLYRPYGPDGSFSVDMLVAPQISPAIDCRRIRCAVVTRNDHTRTSDRSQDLFLPVAFAAAASAGPPPAPAPPSSAQAPKASPAPTPAPAAASPAPPLEQALPAPATALSPDGLSATDSVRTLTVSSAKDLDPVNQTIEVKGKGYDPSKKLLLALCVAPGPGKAPAQCSREGPLRITPAPRPGEVALAADGTFTAPLKLQPVIDEATDCREVPCVVASYNDTDRPVDRSQDIFIPVSFRKPLARGAPEAAGDRSVAAAGAGPIPAWSYPAAGAAVVMTMATALLLRRRRGR